MTGCLIYKRSFRNRKSLSGIKPSFCLPLADFNTMKNNVDQAVAILTARKDKGLFLDANVTAALGRKTAQEQDPEPTPESNDVTSTTLADYWFRRPLGKRRGQSSSRCRNCATPLGSRRRKGCKRLSWIRRALMGRLRDHPGSRIPLARSKLFRAGPTFRSMA